MPQYRNPPNPSVGGRELNNNMTDIEIDTDIRTPREIRDINEKIESIQVDRMSDPNKVNNFDKIAPGR